MSLNVFLPYHRACCAVHGTDAAPLVFTATTAAYREGGGPALDGVSLTVNAGARTALVGPNGAGKSTLLKLAAGMINPTAGTVAVFGHEPGRCQHEVAYLPQRGDIEWTFPVTVRRFVLAGRYVHLGWLRRPGKADHRRVDEALELMGLTALAARPISQLSGGQQQRTLLARAIAHDARLLLLDEPLNAVDVRTRGIIHRFLDQLPAQGKTVVMATHDLGGLDRDFDQVVYLHEGRRIEAGEARNLSQSHRHD
jgi:ABC-type Mn2+/Zn2+ transport system ATPase subunit